MISALLHGASADWRCLRPAMLTVGLRTRTPLVQDAVFTGLEAIISAFPELVESNFDSEDSTFVLSNGAVRPDQDLAFRCTDCQRLEMVYGPRVDFDFEAGTAKLFAIIQDSFGVRPLNVSYLDLQFAAESDWRGNHYSAIWRAFLQCTALGTLFDAERVLGDDVFIRGVLDQHRICAVTVESDVENIEVLKQDYGVDSLRAFVGVAQTKGISPNERLPEVFAEHAKVTMSFIRDKFIPGVVSPLDNALFELSRTGNADDGRAC